MATRVEKLWPGDTFVLLGCGPSLSVEDVNHVRGKARVIAINASHELAPWADVMYAADTAYWTHVKGAPSFTGLKYSVEANSAKWKNEGVQVLQIGGSNGLALAQTHLATGSQSGYQAINLAVHLGAARILLLGYDMRAVKGHDHFNGSHYPARSNGGYVGWMRHFDTLVEPLKKLGVEVINCTVGSALRTFPYVPLREALPDVEAVSAESVALEAVL